MSSGIAISMLLPERPLKRLCMKSFSSSLQSRSFFFKFFECKKTDFFVVLHLIAKLESVIAIESIIADFSNFIEEIKSPFKLDVTSTPHVTAMSTSRLTFSTVKSTLKI